MVKVKIVSPEDLVWKVILPMDRKDRALGNGLPNGKVLLKFCKFSLTVLMRSKNLVKTKES